MNSDRIHPGKRIGHIAVNYRGSILVWGGYNDDNLGERYLPTNEIWLYDPLTEQWCVKKCRRELAKEMPDGISGATGTLWNDYLFVFGGFSDGNINLLNRLDLCSYEWETMPCNGDPPSECDKCVSWTYKNRVYVFGGYGTEPHGKFISQRQPDYSFVFDNNSYWSRMERRGWTNQFCYYDIEKREWHWPKYKGSLPSSRAAHACCRVNSKVYILGGRHNSERMCDLHCFDMERMLWTPIQISTGAAPQGRSWHSLNSLSDNILVLYGGFSQDDCPLGDCWLLYLDTFTWVEIRLPFHKPRVWHASAVSSNGEVIIYGGGIKNIKSPHLRNMYTGEVIVLRFSPKQLLYLCIDKIVANIEFFEKYLKSLPITTQKLLTMKNEFKTEGDQVELQGS